MVWPSVPLVVSKEQTGLAFGILTCAQNVACSFVPLLVAAIYEASGRQYVPNVLMLFLALGVIGLCAALYCSNYDRHHDRVLNRSQAEAEYWRASQKAPSEHLALQLGGIDVREDKEVKEGKSESLAGVVRSTHDLRRTVTPRREDTVLLPLDQEEEVLDETRTTEYADGRVETVHTHTERRRARRS